MIEQRDATGTPGRVPVHTYVRPSVRAALDRKAEEHGSTRSQLAAWLLERAVMPSADRAAYVTADGQELETR
ncbi:MAG: hypothetical protein AB7L13_24990 [Acidimicrobiia bacterium]